jgi:hypothetical protein
MALLQAGFDKDGTVTAANASTLNDGAADGVVTSRDYAEKHNLTILATHHGLSRHAQAPEWFTTAPAKAINKAPVQAEGLAVKDIDLFEINEAFSVVSLANEQLARSWTAAKVNVNGGAVALGHPIGASGARILTTLLYALQATARSAAWPACASAAARPWPSSWSAEPWVTSAAFGVLGAGQMGARHRAGGRRQRRPGPARRRTSLVVEGPPEIVKRLGEAGGEGQAHRRRARGYRWRASRATAAWPTSPTSDLVIEAVTENEELKKKIFVELDGAI